MGPTNPPPEWVLGSLSADERGQRLEVINYLSC
jgi:hypothetical protein